MFGEVSAAYLSTAGVVVVALIGWLSTRRSSAASAGNQVADAATAWAREAVSQYNTDNLRLRAQVDALTAHVDRLTAEVQALRKQVAHLEAENSELLRKLASWDPNEMGGGNG